jgi:cytochrome c6
MNALMTLLLSANAAAQAPAAPAKVDGAKLFSTKCATCHAKDATGNPMMAKMFKADLQLMNLAAGDAIKAKDADLTKVVNDGRNKMPSFKGKLKDEEIKGVLAYVRSLQKPDSAKGTK